MPLRIAKFGLSIIDTENIIIAGGLLMETTEHEKVLNSEKHVFETKQDPSYC